ncbi:Cell division protein FtsZ [Dyadobacter sp. CECT 9275]|uniref:Cell division protein FtsZ n=1 Tax=Dyadobacter helix TaxID=2822344 RepID=A0A916NMT9_9BACT|nr:cell division protein FtsZ [Dyadobacter sp. CECT 9275]CAG5008714.1 Cell division protein FtsZ [Dyadobacter sp. CECT 9275]
MNTSLLQALDQDYIVNEIVREQPIGSAHSEPAIIKVIGVGGGGSNAVNYMFEKKIKDVEFAVCNTDRQALANSPVPTKIQLGATLTQGLGAGTDATKGKEAALETIEEIKALLGGFTQMVFITAGMGGGTGTGAAPVIAQLAKEMGKLTVAVVTAPYTWEGLDKKEQALEGIEQLKEYSDTVLVVLNDKLEELYEDMTLTQAFAEADGILLNAVKSISEIITTSGNINTDFKDVEKVLKKAGQSVMGTAEATGADRAKIAIKEALDSPLLNDRDITGAKRILVTLATSKKSEATMKEQREIWRFVLSQVGGEARMFKLGTITDDSLGDKLRVTIVAAGFDSVESPIPGIEIKNWGKVKEDKEQKEEVSVVTEVTLPEEEESPVMVSAALDATPTGTVVLEVGHVISVPNAPVNISYIEEEEEGKWSDEESARLSAMIKSFREGLVKYADLEGAAYKRSRIDLWKKPAIPANEMEQHWLK